jgi:flagellar biosynthetic protein FlhB
MSDADSAEKEHAPSQRRLDEARARGEVPRSPDLAQAAGYAGLVLAAVTTGPQALPRAATAAMHLLDQPEQLAPRMIKAGAAPLAALLAEFGFALAPFFLLPAGAVLLALVAQSALILAPEKLAVKWSRLSPLEGVKNKFGLNGLFDFGKSLVKLLVTSALLAVFLLRHADAVLATLNLSPALASHVLLDLLIDFLLLVTLIALVIGGLDYLWQRHEHLRRNRMSRQEMVDEHKNSDGDPQAKAQRRQRGIEIATNRMLLDVAKADVVIVNPVHVAVALKWSRADGRAPVCVAKGMDEIADRIRARAAEVGVPLHRDPPTARALHASVRIGQEIAPDHYRAVAAAIRFAEAMRRKARR